MFRSWEADVINMTTVPEVVLAKELGDYLIVFIAQCMYKLGSYRLFSLLLIWFKLVYGPFWQRNTQFLPTPDHPD